MDRNRERYTFDEVSHLMARWPQVSARVIAGEIGRSIHSVRQKAQYLGLRRTAKQKSAIYRTWPRRTWISGRAS